MPLTWCIDCRNDAAIIRLSGQLKLGPQLPQFRRESNQFISVPRHKGFVINMHEVTEMDSAGLGELVILYTAAGKVNCPLCLVAPSATVTRILTITKLSGMMCQFASEKEAIAWILSGSTT